MTVDELRRRLKELDPESVVTIAKFVPNGNFTSAEYFEVCHNDIHVVKVKEKDPDDSYYVGTSDPYTETVVSLNGRDWT